MRFFSKDKPHVDIQTYGRELLDDYDLVFPFHSADINLDNIFIGREKELNKLLDGILSTKQGVYVVSGHRGVGKSRFVERALTELERRVKANNEILIIVIVPLSFFQSELEIMGAILRKLKDCISTPSLNKYVNKNTISDLNTVLHQIENDIEKISDKNISLNLSLPSNPPIGLTAGKSEKIIEKGLLKNYSTKAKLEIINILNKLHNTMLNNKKARLIFVIDELDKIENVEAINEMLGSLKPIFNSAGNFYILMLSANQYLDWTSRDLAEGLYDGLETNPDMYINCIWEIQDALAHVINLEKPLAKQENKIDPQEIFGHFVKYLKIHTRGNLFKLWHKDLPEHLKMHSGWNFLAFSSEHIRKIRFYSGLYDLISEQVFSIIEENEDYRNENSIIREKDLLKSAIYEIATQIIKRSTHGLQKDEIIRLIKAPTLPLEGKLKILTDLLVEKLLENEYIHDSEGKYFLTFRRSIEKGTSISVSDFEKNIDDPKQDSIEATDNSISTLITEYSPFSSFINTKEIHASLIAEESVLSLKIHEADPHRLSFETLDFFEKLDVGRGSENDIQIHDTKISRYHARLAYSEEGWFIYDMNTKNGTLINNNPISKSYLNNGDIIFIGNTVLEFRNSPVSPSSTINPG